MNLGQTLLTLLALTLLSVMVLNFVSTSDAVSTSLDYDRFRLEALSIVTSHIEQLSQYYFDEASTDTTNAKTLVEMTAPGSLGFDANDDEIVDDIDDLHGVTVVDTGLSGVTYHIDYNVHYVDLINNEILPRNERKYHKQVTIAVSDSYNPPLIYHMEDDQRVRDTLSVSVVVSYWFYN